MAVPRTLCGLSTGLDMHARLDPTVSLTTAWIYFCGARKLSVNGIGNNGADASHLAQRCFPGALGTVMVLYFRCGRLPKDLNFVWVLELR